MLIDVWSRESFPIMVGRHCTVILFLVLFFSHKVFSYEKTLRKIVRNQSKMVQRPFSDNGSPTWSWSNRSVSALPQMADAIINPGYIKTKMFHRMQRPKMSTLLSAVDTGHSKSTHSKISRNSLTNDLRLTRNSISSKSPVQPFIACENCLDQKEENATSKPEVVIEKKVSSPKESKFFPPIEDQELQSIEQKTSKEITVMFPETPGVKDNSSLNIKSHFVAHKNSTDTIDTNLLKAKMFPPEIIIVEANDEDNNKADYLLHGNPVDVENIYSYNASSNPYVCETFKEATADIDAQKMFATFEIEPPWAKKKSFWNSIFDSRYEALMRSSKWPPLKVILVPRAHVDSIWQKSFEDYHNDSVNKILSNIVKKLNFYSNMTFTWNEISHLSRWWENTTPKARVGFRRLVKSGRLEITTGGWVEPDEATTHVFGLVHNLIEGNEWLKHHLNYIPEVAWLTNSVSHSPTVTYLLSVLGISQLVFTNVHFSWEQYLAEYQYSDFIWLQNWDSDKTRFTHLNDILNIIGNDRLPRHSVFTHYLQFNSAGFKACGPNKVLCATDFNFAKTYKNIDINTYNVKEKSETLLEQYSKSGTLTPHNTVIAPIGAPYAYEVQSEFDYQFKNYHTIAHFVNHNQGIYKATIEFGTPKDYFKTVLSKHKKYTTLKGDFLNFADLHSGTPAYWTGFYTSRPFFKILLRRLEGTLRTTEILLSFALSLNAFREFDEYQIFGTLLSGRKALARLLDRNVASGTLPANVLRYAHMLVLKTIKDCWYLQEVATSLLISKPGTNKPFLKKYVYREGEFIATFKTVSPEDQIYIFNSLTQERTEIIELVSTHANVRIIDYNRKEVTVQVNPIWKYSQNLIWISRRYFKITFAVTVLPLTLELYRIKTTYDTNLNSATIYCSSCKINDAPGVDSVFPFTVQPVQTGDIQLESYKHRLIFDEVSGFLKTVVEKETNTAKPVVINFGAFNDADVNSGMFLFNTNVTKPLIDILKPYFVGAKRKITMIISGRITTEISTVFGRFLEHKLTIYNLVHSPLSNAIRIENRVDYELSPKNRDLELYMSIQTDIANGATPKIYTDNNGFQHTARVINLNRRIESNLYPITSMAYIQDQRNRLTYITDHAQAVTALQEGQIVVVLDRRVLFDDGRGSKEGLADSSATCHNQYILLENFKVNSDEGMKPNDLSLPSASAMHLANALNYLPDIFMVEQNYTGLCHYGFLPLIKTSFPCDVAIINFRLILFSRDREMGPNTPNTALLVLHRRSFSCSVETSTHLQCSGEPNFSLIKIFRNVRAVYQTNLAGTNKGVPLFAFGPVNFPPMELATLRLYF